MDSRKVLIAEDDSSVRKAVQRVLELENYAVTAVNDGKAALEALATSRFDLAVLDVMMPFADGLTVCREARHRGIDIPILLLTARVEVGDRVAGLDAGADDYLVKPFVIDELLARCRALLRRSQPTGASAQLCVGDLTLNSLTREVHRGERAIELTKTEFDLWSCSCNNQASLCRARPSMKRFGDTTSKRIQNHSMYISATYVARLKRTANHVLYLRYVVSGIR